MIAKNEMILLLGYSAPMVMALMCFVLLALGGAGKHDDRQRNQVVRPMLAALATEVLIWLGAVLSISSFYAFTIYNSFFFLALLYNQAFIYRMIYSLLNMDGRGFPVAHYIVPGIIVGTLIVWSLLVPFEVQYGIAASQGVPAPEYPAFSILFNAPMPTFFVFNVFYSLLTLHRINRYRKAIADYSADEPRSSANWLYPLFVVMLLTLPLPFISLFVSKAKIIDSPLNILVAAACIVQYLMMFYNVMAGNYVIIQPPTGEEAGLKPAESVPLERRRFERYIRERKPYQNPRLRITDLCAVLGTNRTYLSAFINREYGMNFSRYINKLRLDEIDRLRKDPARGPKGGLELILSAGFSNYKGYQRAKKAEDQANEINMS